MSHATVLIALAPEDIERAGSVEAAVDWQMQPFDENGHWFKDGSRWDWFEIGGRYAGRLLGANIRRRSELREEDLRDAQLKRADKLWAEWEADPNKDQFHRVHLYGLKDEDTRDTLRERFEQHLLTAYAFLRDRRWHEQERLGWFGVGARTECEVKAAAHGEDYEGVCLHRDEATGAAIMSYGEGEEHWQRVFFRRFIKNLAPDTTLVMVDYHV